ncbi:MAG: beta-lactamase family protein [Oscillospiraceae bacterium]|nr:beta-lactamase family protein [Oscillospiraceae bacterium]
MKKRLSLVLALVILLALPLSASATEATTPTGIPLSELESRIDELVTTYMHEFTPGLAVAIVHEGEIIFMRGYGHTDTSRQTPIDPSTTVFEFGSTGKLFVWTSVMQLVEQGLINLDNDIHAYLSAESARLFNFEKTFTMRDLLNHSAGFGEFSFNLFIDSSTVANMNTLREELLASQPKQIYTPGTATAYSNFGTALAAYIVSHVSGLEFADFEQNNILNPLGMTNTRNQPNWFGDDAFMQTKARGHQPNGQRGFVERPWVYIPIYPAGALRGTAEDLAQFAIALMPPPNEQSTLFHSRDTLNLMLSPSYSRTGILRGTHHGFMSYDGIYPTIGHGGGTPGFNTEFVIVPSHQFGVILLTNSAGGGALLNEKIIDLLIGDNRDNLTPLTENLPSATNVAGTFMLLNRGEGDITEAFGFLARPPLHVSAIDENIITLNIGGLVLTYRQIAPHLFRNISADTDTSGSRALSRHFYEIYFRMEGGQPVSMSTSFHSDATLQTFGQSTLTLLIFGGIYVISILYLLITSIVVFIKFLCSKDKKFNRFNCLSDGLLACGVLFIISGSILAVRLFADFQFMQTATVTPHVWINYILLLISVVVFFVSLMLLKKDKITKRRKILHFANTTFLALMLFVLWNWNYFVMM